MRFTLDCHRTSTPACPRDNQRVPACTRYRHEHINHERFIRGLSRCMHFCGISGLLSNAEHVCCDFSNIEDFCSFNNAIYDAIYDATTLIVGAANDVFGSVWQSCRCSR